MHFLIWQCWLDMGSRKELNRRTNGELLVNGHPGIKVYYQWYFKNLIEGVCM